MDVETHASRQFFLSLVKKSVHLKNNVAMATESQPTNTQQPAQEIITTERTFDSELREFLVFFLKQLT